MIVRDAEATRQRLIDAARAEFAEYGIAGARVDRIAANATANKAQIYHYFGSKDELFDAVWEALVQQVTDEAPIDVDDLPGYAVRLADGYAEHPDITRLITWQRLERSGDPPHAFAVASTRSKADEIAQAQADGRLPDRFEARVLLGLIIHLAAFWATSSPDVLAVVNVSAAKRRRQVIRDAVASLLAA
jgi:AcrR family transcriptional regulator